AGNVISGNTGDGVTITGSGTTGNVVQGNYIGTDVTGFAALGNSQYGVYLNTASANSILGNTISGNASDGVNITGVGALPGTTASYRADGTANDIVGGNNGTLHGGIGFAPGVSGAAGDQAFSFNGVDSYVQVPAQVLSPTAFTVEAWINASSLTVSGPRYRR